MKKPSPKVNVWDQRDDGDVKLKRRYEVWVDIDRCDGTLLARFAEREKADRYAAYLQEVLNHPDIDWREVSDEESDIADRLRDLADELEDL